MCSIHNIGQIYGVISLVFYLFLSKLPLKKNTLWSAGASFIILAVFFFIIPMVRKPDMSLFNPGWFYIGTVDKIETLRETIEILVNDLSWWGVSIYSKMSTLGLIVVGFVGVHEKKRLRVLTLSLLLLSLTVASVFYIIPWFPALLTNRVWIPLKIILLGAVGTAIWASLKAIVQHFSNIFSSKGETEKVDFNTLLSFINSGAVLIFLIVVLFLGTTYQQNNWLNGSLYRNRLEKVKLLSNTFWFDPTQPEILLSQIEENDYILYMQEMTLYYFLSHGTLESHLVYYSAVFNTPQQKNWIDDNDNLHYLIAMNPLTEFSLPISGAIPLSACNQIIIESESGLLLSDIELFFTNAIGNAKSININYTLEGMPNKTKITIPANTTNWFSIPDSEDIFVNSIAISCGNNPQKLTLEGLRIHGNNQLNWPWDQGVFIKIRKTTNPNEELKIISFSTDALDKELNLNLKVLADDGIFVLAEIVP
jgi:hypothetical protein